jgi:thioredoxin-like negative regulator of GroEL
MIINVTDSKNLNRLNSVLPKKDFFLWFYADWCGHCKSMESEWEKLVKTCGKKFNLARVRDDQKDQLINNLGQNVQGFPTLGSTNNSSDFNTYQGPRTSSDFLNFIKQHLAEEKVTRSMKRKRGCSKSCGKKRNSPCRRRGNNSRKRLVFVKPKKGCGGKSAKRLRAIKL